MVAVAQAGFVAIAPDMRGYGGSSRPAEVEAYNLRCLTGDLCDLLDELGLQRAFFVGHDWGGFVVWAMAMHHEDRCLGVASLNTPLSSWSTMRHEWEATSCGGPMEHMLRHKTSDECGQLDYQVYFNIPEVAERELEADVRRTIHAFFRSQCSGVPRAQHFENMKIGMRTAKSRKDGNRGVLHYCPADIPRDPLWSEEEMQAYVDAFTETGFGPALNWYRNIDANIAWDEEEAVEDKVVQIPCLMVTAQHDVVLNPASSAGMEKRFAKLSRGHVDCGHWVQREAGAEASKIVVQWLKQSAPVPVAASGPGSATAKL